AGRLAGAVLQGADRHGAGTGAGGQRQRPAGAGGRGAFTAAGPAAGARVQHLGGGALLPRRGAFPRRPAPPGSTGGSRSGPGAAGTRRRLEGVAAETDRLQRIVQRAIARATHAQDPGSQFVPPTVIASMRSVGWPTPTGTLWPSLPQVPTPSSS